MIENFKLLTRQHWLKLQLTPSIYINIDLFLLVDWALLPLSTSTRLPWCHCWWLGTVSLTINSSFLQFTAPGYKVALVYRRPADYSYPRVKDCPRKGGSKTSPLSFSWPGFDKAIHRQEHRVIITLPG